MRLRGRPAPRRRRINASGVGGPSVEQPERELDQEREGHYDADRDRRGNRRGGRGNSASMTTSARRQSASARVDIKGRAPVSWRSRRAARFTAAKTMRKAPLVALEIRWIPTKFTAASARSPTTTRLVRDWPRIWRWKAEGSSRSAASRGGSSGAEEVGVDRGGRGEDRAKRGYQHSSRSEAFPWTTRSGRLACRFGTVLSGARQLT